MRIISPVLLACCFAAAQDQAPPVRGCADMEQFLREAKVVALKASSKGVTHTERATLDDGVRKHDASFSTVNEFRASFDGPRGKEANFRDYWGYNIAAYEVAKALEINMAPPYVARKVGGTTGSISWWVPDVMLDEAQRHDRHVEPPDMTAWHREVTIARIFNQLIANTDDNRGNFLITKDWKMWMIDFTRSFRKQRTVFSPQLLTQCDRKLLANLRALNKADLKEKLKAYLEGSEIDAMLARRDQIVRILDGAIKEKGEAVVLFDCPRVGQRCGEGL